MGQRRKRLHQILELAQPGDRISQSFDVGMIVLILLNIAAVVLETVPSLQSRYDQAFRVFEIGSVVVFSIEYLLRLWTCPEDERFRRPIAGRLAFALTPLALIDMTAILPFYLPALLPVDLRFLRALRLLRLFRMVKLGRYSESVRVVMAVLRAKKEELMVTAFVGALLLVLSSSVMYMVERDAQPEAFSSIPAAMWWGVCTLTTVGYGDIYPITPAGKFIGAFIAFLGVGMFALPAGLLATGFSEEVRARKRKTALCPKCGAQIDWSEGESGDSHGTAGRAPAEMTQPEKKDGVL